MASALFGYDESDTLAIKIVDIVEKHDTLNMFIVFRSEPENLNLNSLCARSTFRSTKRYGLDLDTS